MPSCIPESASAINTALLDPSVIDFPEESIVILVALRLVLPIVNPPIVPKVAVMVPEIVAFVAVNAPA